MTYNVTIERQVISAVFDLKGRIEDIQEWTGDVLPPFPAVPNTLTRSGPLKLLWIGRDHWLLRAPIAEEEGLAATLRAEDAPPGISIVLVSDTLAFFDIVGPDADQVMAVAAPLDVHPDVFPETGATYTEAFGQKALILRRPGGFEFAVDRSFADMMEDLFTRTVA